MPLPVNFVTITVTGTYVDLSGAAVVGTVAFTPTFAALQDPTATVPTVVMPKTITATLSAGGAFSVAIPATDDTFLTPTGYTYTVTETFVGVTGRTYSIAVPQGSAGGTIDLAKVAPVSSSGGAIILPNGVAGGGLSGNYPNPTVNPIATPGGLSATGTASATTFLRGDGSWATPAGGGATDATTIAKGIVQLAGDLAGTAALPTVPGALKSANNLSDLALPATARTNLGLGTAATQNKTAAGVAGVLDSTDASTSNARTPSGAASGGLGGTYPSPTVTVVAAGAAGPLSATDPTTTNARTPTAHAATHAAAGADFINPTEQVNLVTVSGAAQTLPDVTVATIHRITLTAACTFTFPAAVSGKSFTVILTQDATGSRTATWPASVVWSGGTAPTLTVTAAKRDILAFISDGTSFFGFTAGLNF